MSDGNVGAQMLRMFVRALIFIIKLIPGIIRLIIKGIKAIINMFQKKTSDPNVNVDRKVR